MRAFTRVSAALLMGLGLSGTAFADAMYIDPTGNVGIGTSTPGDKLHIQGADPRLRFFDETGPQKRTSAALINRRFHFLGAFDQSVVNFHIAAPNQSIRVESTGDVSVFGTLSEGSDINSKQDIEPVNTQEILARVREIPISEWEYIAAPDSRHIGPMAQDFHKAFGLGRDNTKIASIDTGGIALASIQALADQNSKLQAENEALKAQLLTQEERIAALETTSKTVADLEAMVMQLVAGEGSRVANN